jgi:hypothetical protein
MPVDAPRIWALLLIAAAAVSLFFTVRRIRNGGVPRMLATGAVLFRAGLVIIGLVYVTGLVHRSRAALLAAFGVAAAGAVLNLVSTIAGVLAGRRHAAEPPPPASMRVPTPEDADPASRPESDHNDNTEAAP